MSIFTEEDFDAASGGGSFIKWETPGQTVEGKVTKVEYDRVSPKGFPQDVYTVSTDNGVQLIGAGGVLQRQLSEAGAKEGVLLGVRFNGKRQNKAGTNMYNDFSVVVKKQSLFDNVPAPTQQAPANPPAADASDCPF